MRRVGLVAAVLALVMAACGDDDADTSAATSTTVAPTTTTTAAPTTSVAPSTTTTAPAAVSWSAFLDVGDCFLGEELDFTAPPEVVNCSEPHENEVIAEEAIGDVDDAFPGEDAIGVASEEVCAPALAAFIGGRDVELTDLIDGWIVPEETDWAAGDRNVLCVVSSFNGQMIGTAASGTITGEGVRMAALTQFEDQFDLYLLEGPFGEYTVELTFDPAEERTSKPSWTADGSTIYYGAVVDGQAGLYRVATDGSAEPELVLAEPGENDAPKLSPDGTTLVYVSDRTPSGGLDLFLLDLATGVSTPLTDNPDRDSSGEFSPDGTQVVFRARIDGNSDIYVIGVDGTGLTRLTDDPAFDGDPTWTPDGRIVFLSERTGNYDIFVMNADGSNQTNLTNHPANDEYPDVSPDGELVSFHSDRHGGTTLWLMEPDGSNQTVFGWFSPTGYGSFAP